MAIIENSTKKRDLELLKTPYESKIGAGCRTRTGDLMITNQLRYQLSQAGTPIVLFEQYTAFFADCK